MRKIIITCLIVLVAWLTLYAQKPAEYPPNNVYRVGEQLRYVMHYGWVEGGEVVLKVNDYVLDNKPVHHAKATARTLGLADKLFGVYDVYESFFDPKSGLPYKTIKNAKEGKFTYYNEVIFDHNKNIVISKKTGKRSVPDNISDIVAAIYYMRRTQFQNIPKNGLIQITAFIDDYVYDLVIRYMGKETITTKYGNINCLKFKPIVAPGRTFESSDDLTIWVSNDKNYIPIRIQMDMWIGSFKADLANYSGLKYNLIFTN